VLGRVKGARFWNLWVIGLLWLGVVGCWRWPVNSKMAGAWAFGSNLFNQLDPDNNNNKNNKITNLFKHLPNDLNSFHVLHLADSQTLVRYTTSQQPDQHCLEIWGFNPHAPSTHRQPVPHRALSHPLDQIKQWLGRSTILGYLARDGTLNPLAMTQSHQEEKLSPRRGRNAPRYRAVTISDNGLVLAAPLRSHTHHQLELWPSFQELLHGAGPDGAKPMRSINVTGCAGETEIQLSSGAAHFLILTHTPIPADGHGEKDGAYHSSLYAFGDNRFGQVGMGTRSGWVDEPQKLSGLDGTAHIDCGLFHSLALGRDGTLYTFGHNRKGQCGVASTANPPLDTAAPLLVDLGGNGQAGTIIDVLDARCGSEHTVALSSNGLWLAGSNELGQLGMANLVSHFDFQQHLDFIPTEHTTHSAWNIRAGRWNTFVWRNN